MKKKIFVPIQNVDIVYKCAMCEKRPTVKMDHVVINDDIPIVVSCKQCGIGMDAIGIEYVPAK